MARTAATNFTGPLQFPYATSGADAFKKEDVQVLAQAVDQHTHGPGLGHVLDMSGIPPGSITTAMIGAQQVTTPTIQDGAVTSLKIADGTIQAQDIGAGAILGTNLADGSVTSAKIVDGTIQGLDIANGTIVSTNIAAGAIANSNLAVNAVQTANITNATVTRAKLAADATTWVGGQFSSAVTFSTSAAGWTATPASLSVALPSASWVLVHWSTSVSNSGTTGQTFVALGVDTAPNTYPTVLQNQAANMYYPIGGAYAYNLAAGTHTFTLYVNVGAGTLTISNSVTTLISAIVLSTP
jgi:hypothetical protein